MAAIVNSSVSNPCASAIPCDHDQVRMKVELAATFSLVLSLFLHAALVVFGVVALHSPVHSGHPMLAEGAPLASDPWLGETFDIDTAMNPEESDDERDEPAGTPTEPSKPAEPAPTTEPPAAPEPAPSKPLEPPPPQEEPTQPVVPALSSTPASPAQSVPPAVASAPIPASSSTTPSPTVSAVPAVASASPASSDRRPGHGAFGAAGKRRGVRNLATAFARAMPIANSADPVWKTLPVGPAGTLDIILEVGEDGKIAAAKPVDVARAPEHLVRLVQRTLTLLRAGRFALSSSQSEGSETYRLDATIEQVEAAQDDTSAGPYALGFKAPTRDTKGHATFTLRTGRRITIELSLVQR